MKTKICTYQILWDNLGKRGALALWSFVLVIQMFTGLACQLACIRSMSLSLQFNPECH